MKYATYEENLKFVLEHGFKNQFIDEMETIIDTRRDDPLAYIDTSEAGTLGKLKRLLQRDPTNWKLVDYTVLGSDPETLTSVVVSCPRRLVSFRAAKASKEYTEEEKAAIVNRLRESRS